MSTKINELLSTFRGFGQEYTDILITAGACVAIAIIIFCARPKKNKGNIPADENVEKSDDTPEEKIEEVVAEEVTAEESSLGDAEVKGEETSVEPGCCDTFKIDKIDISNYAFETEVETDEETAEPEYEEKVSMLAEAIAAEDKLEVKPVLVETEVNAEEPAAAKNVLQELATTDNAMQKIGDLGMKFAANGEKLQSIEIKIEKAQIVFKYKDDSQEPVQIEDEVVEEVKCDPKDIIQREEPKVQEAVDNMASTYRMSDEIGQALKKQAELENRKFGPDNMNVSHSGRVFSEEELDELIKE